MTPRYIATYGWRDNEPIASVIGRTGPAVRKLIEKAMRAEARDWWKASDDGRKLYEWEEELVWYGVHPLDESGLADIYAELEKDGRDDLTADIRRGKTTII